MTAPAEDWPSYRYEKECGCSRRSRSSAAVERLAQESLSVALRHAQDRLEGEFGFEAATPAGTITLPGAFGGWQHATPLSTVLRGQPPREFTDSSPPRLYRIYQEKKQKPLYIGMAYRSSIRDRVRSHLAMLFTAAGALGPAATQRLGTPVQGLRSEIETLRRLAVNILANPSAAAIKVQAGFVRPHPPHPLDAKLLHAFELALAILERPHAYNPHTWAFEAE